MPEILVKPPELRITASELQQRARLLRQRIGEVDMVMHSLEPVRFDGQLASHLQARYHQVRRRTIEWPVLLEKISEDLYQVANLFEKTDRA